MIIRVWRSLNFNRCGEALPLDNVPLAFCINLVRCFLKRHDMEDSMTELISRCLSLVSLASMCQSSLFYIRTLKDYMIYMAGSRSEVYRYMRYMYRSKLQVKPVNGTSTGWLRTSESWRFRPNRHDERRKGTRG